MLRKSGKLKTQKVKIIRNVHALVRGVADNKMLLPSKNINQLTEAATCVIESAIIRNSKFADWDSYQTQTKRKARKKIDEFDNIDDCIWYLLQQTLSTSTTVEYHLL